MPGEISRAEATHVLAYAGIPQVRLIFRRERGFAGGNGGGGGTICLRPFLFLGPGRGREPPHNLKMGGHDKSAHVFSRTMNAVQCSTSSTANVRELLPSTKERCWLTNLTHAPSVDHRVNRSNRLHHLCRGVTDSGTCFSRLPFPAFFLDCWSTMTVMLPAYPPFWTTGA